jgi:hypothetical protein
MTPMNGTHPAADTTDTTPRGPGHERTHSTEGVALVPIEVYALSWTLVHC